MRLAVHTSVLCNAGFNTRVSDGADGAAECILHHDPDPAVTQQDAFSVFTMLTGLLGRANAKVPGVPRCTLAWNL